MYICEFSYCVSSFSSIDPETSPCTCTREYIHITRCNSYEIFSYLSATTTTKLGLSFQNNFNSIKVKPVDFTIDTKFPPSTIE